MSGFAFEEHKGYCVVRFETDLHEMSWGDVEKEAAEVVEKLKAANTSRIIVDLSPMDLIQSGLVASLVRMWKATEGQPNRKTVVATPNEVVREVIRSAGLFKVFTVVNTREEGAYEIGVSKGAQLEQREKRVVAWVALPAAILAVVVLYPVFTSEDASVRDHAELGGVLLAAFACMTSLFSMAKDEGWRRGLGVVAMLIGLGVLGAMWMQHNGGLPGAVAPDEASADDAAEDGSDAGGDAAAAGDESGAAANEDRNPKGGKAVNRSVSGDGDSDADPPQSDPEASQPE